MFRVVHFVSVGVSVLRNALPRLQDDGAETAGFVESCLGAGLGGREDLRCLEAVEGGEAESVIRAVAGAVEGSPWRASAELNSMRPWLEAGGEYSWRVILYPTLTGAGMLAGRVLERVLRDRFGVEVSVRPVEGFHLGVVPGIVGLLRWLGYDLDRWLGDESVTALINATGGFKPESGFMLLEGLIRGGGRSFAVFIHELHRQPSVIPLVTGEGLERGLRELARALEEQASSQWVRVELGRLGGARWLARLAHLLAPLGRGQLEGESVVLERGLVELLLALRL